MLLCNIFYKNEALHLLMESESQKGGWIGWSAHIVQDWHRRVSLGLNNKVYFV